jgi:hypothetical protein
MIPGDIDWSIFSRDEDACDYTDINDCLVVFEEGPNPEHSRRQHHCTTQPISQRVKESVEYECEEEADPYEAPSVVSVSAQDSRAYAPRNWSEKSIESVINNPTDPIGKVHITTHSNAVFFISVLMLLF